MLEFTLVGVPLIFVMISTFEMSRGMWLYHTLNSAIKEGTRYAIVHGQNCSTSPNACTITIGNIATRIHNAGTGLETSKLNVTLTSMAGSTTCMLNSCLTNTTTWPSGTAATVGNNLTISATYPFDSVITILWGHINRSYKQTFTFTASSMQRIQF